MLYNRHMSSISNKDYLDILNMVYSVNQSEDLESFLGALCPSIMQIFHAECVTFHLIKGYPSRVNIAESRSFKSDGRNLVEDNYYPELYRDGYYHSSPLLREAISSTQAVLKVGDSISLRDWERSDLYNDFILPQHLYWEMFLTLRWKNKLKGMMTLWRSKQQPDYERGDIEKAEILVPHLMLAIHNVNTISKIQGWEKQFLSPDEATDEGLLLLDHKFRPIHSNAKAREICLYLCNRIPPDIINLEKGEFPMPSSIVKDCSDLLELFKADARFILWPKERIIFVESGKNFRSECSLIWKTDQINSTPNFMVTLSDLTDKKKKLENTLQVSFHLSKREVDIVYCIMADMSYNEIAEMLYISKLTVRTHVKNIYRKLKITNKIELYRFIQSLTWLI
jgi:DNA-binding CsgD family transcriptional regulator